MNMRRSLDQRIKESLEQNKQTKITFTAPVKVEQFARHYLEFYQQTHDDKITLDVLFSNIIDTALSGDQNFRKWLREKDI